jgi:carboxyl-terminal processing protease
VYEATGEVATRKPVVVLVDRGTASASEIVTAALHERLDAPVVGLRTFGKGVTGQIFNLSNGGALDLVVGNYYTPAGRNLTGRGIRPDVRARDDVDTRRDEALERALDTLSGSIERSTERSR